ncbi:MAG: twin-arginine translocase subunit TatB [Pseudolabrys sp.]|nr:twin-arginine translocase subunit TatB [Pseudolabrys sp.]
MFDIGWGELVVIGVVALIAIGPKELPGVLRTLGQAMGKVRRMAAEFQGQFNEAMREAEMADLKKQVEDTTSSFTNYDPLAETKKDIEKAFDEPAAPTPNEVSAAALPQIDVPLPAELPPMRTEDFAPPAPVSPVAAPEGVVPAPSPTGSGAKT